MDVYVDLRTHHLVPSINGDDEGARVVEASCAAEWVREGCILCEVFFYGCALDGGGGLGEETDDLFDFAGWWWERELVVVRKEECCWGGWKWTYWGCPLGCACVGEEEGEEVG